MSDKKEKKNLVKKVARLNSKDKKKIKKEGEKKSKKARNWIFGISALTIAGAAAGMAVFFTRNKTEEKKPLASDATVYAIEMPNGQKINVTVKDVLNASMGFFDEQNGQLAKAKRELVLSLYEEEVEASNLFQKAWDASKKEGEESKTFQIDTLEEVRVKQKNNLEDKKRTFQKTFSVQNWENEWKKELQKEELGKSASDEQAIEYLTLNTIKDQAFARWTPKIDDTFSKYDVEERIAKEDIEATDKDGKKMIVYAKGERIFKNFLNTVNTTTDKNQINGFLPKVAGSTVTSSTKVNAFITKSFVPKFIKADSLIKTYIDQFGYAFNSSELVINASQDLTNASLPWKVTKNLLIELLTYKVLSFSDDQNVLSINQNIELIGNFKGSTNTTEDGIKDDNLLLKSINPSVNSENNLGAKPLRNIFEIYNEEDVSYANGYLDNIFEVVQKPNLFASMLDNLREALFKNTKDLIAPLASSLVGKSANEIEQANIILQREINKKSDAEITELAGGVFRDLFATSETNHKTKTIYKIDDNKFVLLSSKGIHYALMNAINTVESFKNLIDVQVQLKANQQFDSKQKPTTDIVKTFSFFNSEDHIFANRIKESKIQKLLAEKLLKDGSEEEKQKLINNLVKQGSQIEINYFIAKALESFEKIQAYIETTIDKQLNSDYSYDSTLQEFVITGNSSKQAAVKLLFDKLKSKGEQK